MSNGVTFAASTSPLTVSVPAAKFRHVSAPNSNGRAQQDRELCGGTVGRGTSSDPGVVISTCGLVISEIRQAPGRSDESENACSKFFLVLSGQARWECGSRRYMLGPDTVCHIPAGLRYCKETLASSPFLAYAIHYRSALLAQGVGNQLAALGMVPIDLGTTTSNQARVVRSVFQEMLFEQNARQEGWEAVLHSRLMDLAVRVVRLVSRRGGIEPPVFEPGSESIDRVARYAVRVRSQFFRQETIVEAARSVGLSRRQFAELFRKATGQNWRQYVLGLRLKHAAELLAGTDRSVSAVAFECGFDDLSNFHHSFKAVYGCSPLGYRDQRRIHLPVEMYPGMLLVALSGNKTGFNPVRAQMDRILAAPQSRQAALAWIGHLERLAGRLDREFPDGHEATKSTLREDNRAVKQKLAAKYPEREADPQSYEQRIGNLGWKQSQDETVRQLASVWRAGGTTVGGRVAERQVGQAAG